MRAGVILGSYNYPRLIETQIKLIRECNGADTPILVSDDCSPGCMDLPDYDSQFTTLLKIVEDNNVALWCSPDRLGHVGGDLACYYLGIQWGKMHGLDVVCKLSQRLLIDIPCWLDESSEKLLAGASLASRARTGYPCAPRRSCSMLTNGIGKMCCST